MSSDNFKREVSPKVEDESQPKKKEENKDIQKKKEAWLIGPKEIQIFYGILDFVLLVAALVFYCVSIGRKANFLFLIVFLFQIPNLFGFIYVLVAIKQTEQSTKSSLIYKYILGCKILIQMFILPLLFLWVDIEFLNHSICASVMDITQDQLKDYINQANVSALYQQEGLGIISMLNYESRSSVLEVNMLPTEKFSFEKSFENFTTVHEQGFQNKISEAFPYFDNAEKMKTSVGLCITNVMLGTAFFFFMIQLYCGHQYIIAREVYKNYDLQQKYKKKEADKEEARRKKEQEGMKDPVWLEQKLKKILDLIQEELKKSNLKKSQQEIQKQNEGQEISNFAINQSVVSLE